MNTLRFRTLVVATVLVAVASLCHLSALYDQTQVRVDTQGTWCLRTGRTYNANGELVENGLWWGADGKRQEVKEWAR